MNIGDELRKRKLELGMSLKDIAERAGVSRATVGRALSKNYVHTGIYNLHAIAQVLGYSFSLSIASPAKQ